MLAQYMAVQSNIINKMKKMDNEDIIEEIEELSDNEGCDICDVDQMWDALHFFLTGKSASAPIKNNRLSEAVVGTNKFTQEKSEELLSYIKCDELPQIIEAMEETDIEKCKEDHTIADYEQAKIYPRIWKKVNEDEVFEEIIFCFEGLLDFYKNCYKKKLDIVVSIY